MKYQILTGTPSELTKKVQSALDEKSGWILCGAPFHIMNSIHNGEPSELAQAMYQLTVVTPEDPPLKEPS